MEAGLLRETACGRLSRSTFSEAEVQQRKGVDTMAEEMFKTTLMGGFDKDDVLSKVQTMKDDAYAERSKLLKEGRAKDKRIAELERKLAAKESEKKRAAEEAARRLKAEQEKMQQQLDRKDEEVHRRQQEMNRELVERDRENERKIEELKRQHEVEKEEIYDLLREKTEQKDRLEREISQKYQKYIDRYDQIGALYLRPRKRQIR